MIGMIWSKLVFSPSEHFTVDPSWIKFLQIVLEVHFIGHLSDC